MWYTIPRVPQRDLTPNLASLLARRWRRRPEQTPDEFLARHHSGDWGDLGEEDIAENELSLEKGFRLLSAYQLNTGVRIWIITEADRSATTILLPEEY